MGHAYMGTDDLGIDKAKDMDFCLIHKDQSLRKLLSKHLEK